MITLLLILASACPHPHRSEAPKIAFAHLHACPSTGLHIPHCPGYVIDHIVPLCACGPDAPSNMQWQSLAASKVKDRLERKQCRRGHA